MFSWDGHKALRNLRKHGVPFEAASTVFADPAGLDLEVLEHPHPERRWIRIGMSIQGRALVVVYTLRRLKDGTETIRIISARRASRKERQAYSG